MKQFLLKNNWWFYFILTYFISWTIWSLGSFLFPEDLWVIFLIIGAFGPFGSALIILRISGGKELLYKWLRIIFNFRIKVTWYLFAGIVFPFFTAGLHHIIYLALGGKSGVDFGPEWIIYIAYLIPTALLSGGNEEPGWRGYITPILIGKFDILSANLIVGIGWALWHVPLYALGIWDSSDQSVIWLFIYCFPLSIILTWLFYVSKRSIIPAMLFHAGGNVVFQYFPMETTVMESVADEFTVIKTGVYWLLAIALLLSTKGKLGYKKKENVI